MAAHPFIDEITSAPKWKDADEKTRRESVRQFAIASKAEGMDPTERGVILDGLYDAAGAKGAMGWLVNAAKEGLKSIPASTAAVVGAAAELSGAANDTGAETRLGQGVEDMLDSGVQLVKSMAPGDWQEKRDAAFAAFKQDLDTGAYPPEFGTLMSMSMDEQSGRGAEFKPAFDYINGWREVLMHANILADRGPTTGEKNNLSPGALANFKRAGQGIYDHRLQEFIADYMATRDPAAWGVIESIGKETETSYEIRKTQEKEAGRYADFDPENSLLDDLSLRAAGFQRSPIDMAMTVFPVLRGATALKAARSTGLAAGLKHAAGAAAGEFVSGAASEALSAGGTASAGQVAEAGAMEAVGGGVMAGGSAVAGKAMQLLPGKRTAGAQSSPSVDTTQGAPATPAAGAAQTEEAASAPAPVEPVEALTDPDFDGTLLSELLPAGEMGSDGGMEGMSDGEMGSEGPSSPLLPDQESAPAPTPSEGASALEQAFRMAAARGQSPAVESAPPTLEATPEMLRFAAEGAFRDAGADIQPGTVGSPPVPDTAETVAGQNTTGGFAASMRGGLTSLPNLDTEQLTTEATPDALAQAMGRLAPGPISPSAPAEGLRPAQSSEPVALAPPELQDPASVGGAEGEAITAPGPLSADVGARRVTPAQSARMEETKANVRAMLNVMEPGRQRADFVENSNKLLSFLSTRQAADLKTAFHAGNEVGLVAYDPETGDTAPAGFEGFVYLDGPKMGQFGVRRTSESKAADEAQLSKEWKDQQAGFSRLRGKSDQMPALSPQSSALSPPPPATPGTVASPPVPDTAETVAEQARLAADPASTRRAVLITPGTPKPPKTPGLKALQTPHGLVLYNPAKISAAAVQAAGAGEVFDARVLGMSGETQGSRLKAETGPALAVTASTPAAPNVQAELVNDPAALPGAIAAAQAAAPGAAVEVKPANQVLTERAAGATSGALPDAAATNQRAKEKAGQPPALAAGKPAAKAPAVKRNQFKPDVRRYPVASQLAIAPQNPARQLAKWRKQQKGGLEGALTTGDRKLSKERGEYNDLPTIGEFQGRPIAQDALRRIYRNGNTLSPDKAFKQVGIEDLEQGIAQLRAELRSMDTIAREEKAQATQERQGEAFYMAISDGPVALHSSQLKKGDVLNIEGEEARVIQVKYDEGEWTPSKVVLEDGRKFGRQTLDGDTALFVEGYEPASAAGFGLEAQTDAQIEQERQTAADRARTAAARQAMQDRAAAPLTGRDTTGQGALFANDPANDLFSGPSAEEMPFSKRTPGKRVTAADWVPALGQLERNAPELVQNLRVVTRAADLSPADFTADQWQSILEHRPEGFFHARNDGVVVILDNLQRRPGETGGQAVTRVVQHEQLGHRGLRVALKNAWFRRDWEALAKMVPQSELDAVAKDYPDLAGDRMSLVEEWFARRAGEAATAPRGSLLRRMYDAFKEWVARVWRNIAGDQRTLEQRTQDAIKASRRALESRASSGGDSLLMSRAPGADPADAIPAVPPGMDINRYGQRVQADERLREEWRAQFTPALYKTFGEAELSKRVAAWIGREGGLEQGAALFLDAASGLADYERNALGQQVAIGLDQRARRAAAAGDAKATHATESLFDDVIGVLEVLATQAGQALRSFGMWARFSPRGIVRTFERAVEKTRTTQAAKALGVDPKEMPAVMEEAAAAVKAAHTRTTAERKARTTDIAQKWIQRLATVQSDTLSWRTAPKLSELERLIREHMRAPVADFDARVQALGVDPHSAGVLDRLVMEDHRRRPAIERAAEQEAFIKSLLPRAPRAARAKIPAFVEAIFKAARNGVLTRSDFLDAYSEKFGHPRFTPEFAAAIRQQVDAVQSMPEGSWLRQREQSRLMAMLAQHEGISARDVFTSFWYANILSGAGTHLVNITGNATHLLLRTVQVALTSRPQDTIAFVRGMLHGAAQGRIQAAAAFKNGEPVMRGDEEWQKMDVLELMWSENPDTWAGKLAKYGAASWGRYIFRALTAADAFFWNSAKEGRAWLETSRRLAKGENLKTALGLDAPQWAAAQEQAAEELKAAGRGSRTADIDRRAMEIVEAGREADITHEARKWAAHTTYNYEPEGTMGVFAAGMNLITKHFAPARAVVPFVRIVANMTDVSLDWTPIGLLRAAKGSHLVNVKSSGGRIVAGEKFSPRDRAERAIAGAVGTLALGALYTLASAYADDDDESVPFMLYGMGPSDPGRRKQMPKGWKPYSMKIGDYYVSFEGTPLAFAMSMVGTALDKRRYTSRPGDDGRLMPLLLAGPKAMMNSGFLSSLKDSFDMLSGDRKPGVWAERTAAGLIPAASFLKDVATALDPVEVDQTRFGATFLSYLPVLRGEQQPRLNVFGEPVETPGPWLIQRIIRRAEKQDAQASWLTRNGLHIPDLDNDVRVGQWLEKRDKPRSAGGLQADRAFRAETLARLSNGDLTPQERTEFLRTTGPQIRKAITILEQRAAKGAKIDQNDVTTAVSRIRRAAMKGLVR